MRAFETNIGTTRCKAYGGLLRGTCFTSRQTLRRTVFGSRVVQLLNSRDPRAHLFMGQIARSLIQNDIAVDGRSCASSTTTILRYCGRPESRKTRSMNGFRLRMTTLLGSFGVQLRLRRVLITAAPM
jgi:hypothetical protein